ncbi:MAG: VCBS repeat-containing protein, partial [Planctomycetales bacterium]|nr:VCBS repeat-containing protein [Planctomycetales bacterium]
DGTVRDASAAAGVDWLDASAGALFVDLDNDGDQDLVVGAASGVLFHENDGAGKFALKAARSFSSMPQSLSAADYNQDGKLDIYICGHTPSGQRQDEIILGLPVPFHDANNGASNALLRNDGQWAFTDVTAATGLNQNNHRFSYACAWEDYDNDGDQDLYVANDFGRNNLYRNDGGFFRDVAAAADVEDISSGMSVSWGDYNGDGWMDVYVGNMFSSAGNRITYQRQFQVDKKAGDVEQIQRMARGNSLFANSASGFRDVSLTAHVNHGRWAWGSKFVDVNNDGREDIVVANGFVTGTRPDDL